MVFGLFVFASFEAFASRLPGIFDDAFALFASVSSKIPGRVAQPWRVGVSNTYANNP